MAGSDRGRAVTDQGSVGVAPAPGQAPTSSGWTGMVVFGGLMLCLVGAVHAVAGFAAIFNDDFYDVASDGIAVSAGYGVWGWLHLTLGVVAIVTGWGLMTGRYWAHGIGIGLAFLSAVTSLLFLSAQPWWAIITIAFDLVVIYAITQHDPATLRRPE